MDNRKKHQHIVKNAKKIVELADRRGTAVAAEKFNISPYGVYVAKALTGEYVPPATMSCIIEDNPSMQTRKKRR